MKAAGKDDFRLIPNLDDFREDIAWAFEELRKTTVARFLSRRTAPPEEPDRASEARQTPAPPPRIGLARIR